MEKYVLGIGAANVDIYAKSSIKIREHFDHPSIINTTVGGVTRNILENISRLGIKTKLLTAVGDDIYGKLILEESSKVGIDVKEVMILNNEKSGVFMQVQDNNNDMHIALCDMSISKNINIKYIESKRRIIEKASAVVLDPSLDDEVIEYLLNNFEVKFFVDPISDFYAKKYKKYLYKTYSIKPNKTELSQLASMNIDSENDLYNAFDKVQKKLSGRLFVSLGREGCMFINDEGNIEKRAFKPVKKMINASGAGDSMMACLVYGYVKGLSVSDTIDYALAAGIATILDEHTINPKMSVKLLRNIIKENKNGL